MRVAVLVKSVPDAQSERRIEDGRLARGDGDDLDEIDENAVEAAVALAEDQGGESVALTAGPEGSEEALMRALQMGAGRGVHVCDPAIAGADVPATAAVLATAIGRLESESAGGAAFDLVILGAASIDGGMGMLASALAAELDRPLLSLAKSLEVADGGRTVRIVRSADGFDEELRAPVPAVVSVTDSLNEPRYPTFQTMRAARGKPLDTWTLADLGPRAEGRVAPLAQVVDAQKRPPRGGGRVVRDEGDGGRRLAAYLEEALR